MKNKKILFAFVMSFSLDLVFCGNKISVFAMEYMEYIEAARNGDLDLLKKNISEFGDLNITDSEGGTAISLAAERNFEDIVEFLIDLKVNLNLQDDYGYTPLMLACAKGNLNIVKLLINAKVNLNLQNDKGETALIRAFKFDKIVIVQLLIEADANFRLRDNGRKAIFTLNYRYKNYDNNDNLLHILARIISNTENGKEKKKINFLQAFLLILSEDPKLISFYNKNGNTPFDINPVVVICLFGQPIGTSESYISRIDNLKNEIINAFNNNNIQEVAKKILIMNEINLDKNWANYLTLGEGNKKNKKRILKD